MWCTTLEMQRGMGQARKGVPFAKDLASLAGTVMQMVSRQPMVMLETSFEGF